LRYPPGSPELRPAWAGEGARPHTITVDIKTNGGGQECPPYTGKIKSKSNGGGRGRPPHTTNLDIQILYVDRVVFYEFSSRLYVFAHQRGEDGFGFWYVF
jgi:hypothetical protein